LKFCEECGSPLKPDSKFCENCGMKIDELHPEPPIDSKTEPAIIEEPFYSKTETSIKAEPIVQPKQPISESTLRSTLREEHTPDSQKIGVPVLNRKKNTWLYFIALVMIIAGAVYFFNRNSADAFNTAATESSSISSIADSDESSSTATSTSESESSSEQADSEEEVKNEDVITAFDSNQVRSIIENAYSPIMGTFSAYVSRIGNENEVVVNEQPQRAASTIKLFIMLTTYSKANANELDLDSIHRLYEDEKVGGTGIIQDMPGGSELTIRELIRLMIVESDNTAANIMIDELGGFESINQMISKMGCYNTALNRKMMDTNALESGIDNYTSAKDLGVIMKKLYMNTLISEEYDNEMLSILSHNTDHSKLPYHLPYGATVFNKTGTYSTYGVENDVAIIANENGAFVVSVMTQDGSAVEQIDAMKSLGLNLYENILN
jgi:beta-lactamase class A